MSGLFRCLKTTVVPCLVKTRSTHPRHMEPLSDGNTPENGPYRGTTRVPQDTGEGILNLLDIMIHDETSNLRRRDNMQLVRDFIEKHGWPEEGCVIWALKGVVLVLTEGQWMALPQSPDRGDAFELVSSNIYDSHRSESSLQDLRLSSQTTSYFVSGGGSFFSWLQQMLTRQTWIQTGGQGC